MAPLLKELRRLKGPEQLKKILDTKDQLKDHWDEACTLVERKEKRWPKWERLLALMEQVRDLPIHQDLHPQVEAIHEQRSLLDSTTDYVAPLLQQLENALWDALEKARQHLAEVSADEQQQLEASAEWQSLPETKRHNIAQEMQLSTASAASAPVERSKLLATIQQRSLASWAELAESLPTRFTNARIAAAKELEPDTQPLKLSSGVLKDEAALDVWWDSKREELLTKLQQGPIQIN
ncbi:MAG: hypothetical protein ERJ68_09060 [Aphanocapsa feldmannii 277cI]|uniref:Uncharacterized protein n=1 Tax=Aphanocapsa feldmannii 277cI TaxID=2507554 RepID=A0A524RSQ1_9CHRO|nr:MAG: hypothetical protein ERJ68_09060 [Aphanocapsa feldmannii 277cI]